MLQHLKKQIKIIDLLARSIDLFFLENLYVAQLSAVAMTAWLAKDKAPFNFSTDQDIELRASNESRATIRYVKHIHRC